MKAQKFPDADTPLNFEHVLFNHLEVLSWAIAQGTGDLGQLVEIFECYVTPNCTERERDVFRKFKEAYLMVKEIIQDYYEREIDRYVNSGRPSGEIKELTEERDVIFNTLSDVYDKMILKWAVSLAKRRYNSKSVMYKEWEFWRDFIIELRRVLGDVFYKLEENLNEVLVEVIENADSIEGESSSRDTIEAGLAGE